MAEKKSPRERVPVMKPVGDATATENIPPVEPPALWDYEADIVIVGAGGSGLCAASAAINNGKTIINIEKMDVCGGSSSHGGAAAAYNSNATRRAKLKFNRASAYKNALERTCNGSIDPRLVATLVDRSHEVYDWAETQSWGDGWDCMTMDFIPDQGVARHMVKSIGFTPFISGTEFLAEFYPFMEWIESWVRENGGKILLNTPADALVMDEGRVVGVKATDANGSTIFLHAKEAVIMCGGGMTNNRAMLEKYCPQAYRKCKGTFIPPWDTGECDRMVFGAGADLAGFNSFTAFSGAIDFLDEDYTGKSGDEAGPWFQYLRQGYLQLARGGGWLVVNKSCEEFMPVSLLADYELHPKCTSSQVDACEYVLFDDDYEDTIWETTPVPMLDDRPMLETDLKFPWYEKFAKFQPKDWRDSVADAFEWGGIKKADTIEELAEQLGLDPQALKARVDAWNAKAKSRTPDEFGRNPRNVKPILKAPFYGIKTGANLAACYAGPRVNWHFEVIGKDGAPIPGLYAGGMNAGGMVGEDVFQASCLSALGLALATGWMAGDNASNPDGQTYEPKDLRVPMAVKLQEMQYQVGVKFPGLMDKVMDKMYESNLKKTVAKREKLGIKTD